jgi:putative Mg2+ transporter-C (MgtC) family protein
MHPNWMEIILQIALALAIGALIGWEREKSRRPAGLRTHMLVCVGAALCMMVGYYGLQKAGGHGSVDPTRIASQVISGIGFLGAGTILREGFSVRGLTTAASLWTVACIGLAVGLGCYFAAILAAVMVFAVLTLVEKLEQKVTGYIKNKAFFTLESTQTVQTMVQVQKMARKYKMHSSNMKITEKFNAEGKRVGCLSFQIEDRSKPEDVQWETVMEELRHMKGIRSVEMELL